MYSQWKAGFLVNEVLKSFIQARSQDHWWGTGPQNVNLLDPKSGLFETHPLNPLTNTPFFGPFCS